MTTAQGAADLGPEPAIITDNLTGFVKPALSLGIGMML